MRDVTIQELAEALHKVFIDNDDGAGWFAVGSNPRHVCLDGDFDLVYVADEVIQILGPLMRKAEC